MGRNQRHRNPVKPSARRSVISRDGKYCRYCGKGPLFTELDYEGDDLFLTLDHVTASLNGGTNTQANLVVSCARCNSLKGDRSLTEVEWALLPPNLPHLSEGKRRELGWSQHALELQRHRINKTKRQIPERKKR